MDKEQLIDELTHAANVLYRCAQCLEDALVSVRVGRNGCTVRSALRKRAMLLQEAARQLHTDPIRQVPLVDMPMIVEVKEVVC